MVKTPPPDKTLSAPEPPRFTIDLDTIELFEKTVRALAVVKNPMFEQRPIFRKAALDRLSSPEELDELMQITTPRAWLALAGIGVLLLAGFFWAILDRMPSTVHGEGLLIYGEPLKIDAIPGDPKKPAESLPSPESATNGLKALIFVDASQAYKIKPGMNAQIIATTFRKVEYGYIFGKIRTVSNLPSSRSALMPVLEDEQLVEKISKRSAPVAMYADLVPAGTPSGFKWSSSSGPPSPIYPGTFCSASIVVSEQRPIALVIPALRKFFGF